MAARRQIPRCQPPLAAGQSAQEMASADTDSPPISFSLRDRDDLADSVGPTSANRLFAGKGPAFSPTDAIAPERNVTSSALTPVPNARAGAPPPPPPPGRALYPVKPIGRLW